MGRTCSVCSHEASFEVNEMLVLEGKSNRAITRQFGLSKDAVRRYREHIPQLLLKAQEAEETTQANELVQQVKALQGRTIRLLNKAEEAEDLRSALSAIREARGNFELLAKLRQVIDERPQVDIHLHPEYLKVEALIVETLEDYPAAFDAVLAVLRGRHDRSAALGG